MRKFLVLLALFASQAWATPALVGTPVHANAASSTTCAVTISSVTANDMLFFEAFSASNVALSSIADSSGNTVSAAEAWTTNGAIIAAFGTYYVQAASAGSHTVTLTTTGSSNITCFLAEYSGISTTAALDTAATIKFSSASTTAITSNSTTPVNSGDLVIFAFGQKGTGATFSAYNNSFVQQDSQNAATPDGAWASEIQASAAAISGAATSSVSNNFGAGVVSFTASTGAACTHNGRTQGGAISVPNGSTGSYRLQNGTFGTPNCSSGTKYYSPQLGNFTLN